MIKRVVIFRFITWGIGVLLALISSLIFFNNNDVVWNITRRYNEIVSILSLIPVAQIMLLVAIIRNKKQRIIHILLMIMLLISFLIYICMWVACSGGV